MRKALENLKKGFLQGSGKGNTKQEEVTIALTVDQRFVPVSFTVEQQFSLGDWEALTKEQLYLFINNAQTAIIQAARVYKVKSKDG